LSTFSATRSHQSTPR